MLLKQPDLSPSVPYLVLHGVLFGMIVSDSTLAASSNELLPAYGCAAGILYPDAAHIALASVTVACSICTQAPLPGCAQKAD